MNRHLALTVAGTFACLSLVACGADSDAGQTSAESTDCVSKAQAMVDEAGAPIEPTLPGDPVDMKAIAGSKVWLINVARTAAVVGFTKDFTTATDAAGLDLTVFDGQGLVTEWNKGIELAISDGADAIVLDAIDAETVSGAVQKASEAGIVIIDTFRGAPDEEPPAGVYGGVNFDAFTGAAGLAAWTLVHTDCQTDAGFLYDPAFDSLVGLGKGYGDTIKKLCASCTYVPITFNLGSMATEITTALRGAITKYPDMNVVLSSFDSALPFVLPVVDAAGGDVDNITVGVLPDTLDYMKAGDVKATMGYYIPSIPWMWLDQVARGISGMPRSTVGIPTRLIISDEVASGDDLFPAFSDFESEYLKEWGLQS